MMDRGMDMEKTISLWWGIDNKPGTVNITRVIALKPFFFLLVFFFFFYITPVIILVDMLLHNIYMYPFNKLLITICYKQT